MGRYTDRKWRAVRIPMFIGLTFSVTARARASANTAGSGANSFSAHCSDNAFRLAPCSLGMINEEDEVVICHSHAGIKNRIGSWM